MAFGRVAHTVLVGVLVFGLILPLPSWSGGLSLGTARGLRAVELSLDGGKSWLPLNARPLPLLDGTQVRSTNGGAVLDFADGSRVSVLPFSSVQVRETGRTGEVSLVYGRVTFKLPASTRVELRTASVRLEPVRAQGMAGELFVGREGTMGLKLSEGSLQVHELTAAQPARLASNEPVFLPKRPATSSPLFTSDVPSTTPPDGAKAVFSPRGESLGYLRPDGQLVVHPGFSADLTQPFAPKLIQVAMARVPENDRSDAMPVFDVNGGYVGYLAGPVFYAQAQIPGVQVAQVPPGVGAAGGDGTILGMETTTFFIVTGALVVAGGTLGGLAASGTIGGAGGDGGAAATALTPRR